MLAKHFRCVVVSAALFVILPEQVFPQDAPDLKRFAGTWKEDVAKRKIDLSLLNPLRFQRKTDGSLEEVRGPEGHEIGHPIVFDDKPRDIGNGNAVAWKQTGPNSFERVLFNAGEQRLRQTITIAGGGKTLTEVSESKTTDGVAKTTATYERVSGEGQELVGTWKPRSIQPPDMQIRLSVDVAASNALKVTTDTEPLYTVTLDGTPSPNVSRFARKGTMVAAKLRNGNTIEFTHSLEGLVTQKETWSLSADGKSMVVTITPVHPKVESPSSIVFVKQ